MGLRTALRALAVIAVVATPAATALQAETFPAKPIRIVVPYAPGGAVDGTARLLANELQKSTNQTVVVENRQGASGMIAVDYLRRSAPDGYTILIDTIAIAVNPSLNKAPYDPIADFTPVSQVMAMPYAVAVNPNSGMKTPADLLKKLRDNPGKLNSTSSGTGSQLASEFFRLETKTEFQIIPYPGAAPGILAVIGGECEMVIMDMANIAPFITSGKLTGLVVSTPNRSDAVPNVPSATEAGIPGYEVRSWFGIFGPKGIPTDRTEYLNAHIRQALDTPAFVQLMKSTGSEPSRMNAAEFQAFYEKEVARWRKVVKEAGIAEAKP